MTDVETMKRIRSAGKAVLEQASVMSSMELARNLARLACQADLITALSYCEREMLKRSTCE